MSIWLAGALDFSRSKKNDEQINVNECVANTKLRTHTHTHTNTPNVRTPKFKHTALNVILFQRKKTHTQHQPLQQIMDDEKKTNKFYHTLSCRIFFNKKNIAS